MTYQELDRKVQTAGVWFVGSFMGEFIHDYGIWHDQDGGKPTYIRRIQNEYGKPLNYKLDSTKAKCYALMSIIENHKVIEAIELVINTNEKKVAEGAYENAVYLLDKICNGEIELP